jgi:integrase
MRRNCVRGRPGIYVRTDSKGRERFEYCYRDSEGKQRWRTVEGGVAAAIAGREDVRATMRRGERIAPSKITLAELASQWLEQVTGLRRTSKSWYESALRRHVVPKIGAVKVSDLTIDDMAQLIAELGRDGLAPATVRNVLVPLNRVLDHGVRRGLLTVNPVRGLERHERPKVDRDEMRILSAEEIDALIKAALDRYRALLATAVFTGLRQGELLGLRWSDIDLDAGVVHVHHQVDRTGNVLPLKTRNARRDVLLMPALARMLREHRIGSSHSQAHEYVFARPDGRPMAPDTVRRYGLLRAVERAGLNPPGKPRLRFHDLRHCFASLLIAQGVNVAFASRQLGHASISTTLNTYTHLFDHAEHAKSVIERLEGRFGEVLQSADANGAVQDVSALGYLGHRP